VQALNILEIMGPQAQAVLPALKQFAARAKTRKDPDTILDEKFDYDLRAARALIARLEPAGKE
jgi:hypothetical protein